LLLERSISQGSPPADRSTLVVSREEMLANCWPAIERHPLHL
jgi:hypothetical protein